VSASAGLEGSRGLAIVLETLAGARLKGRPQQIRVSGGFLDLSTQHRDTVFSGGVSLSLIPTDPAVSVRVVGLVGVARRHTVRRGVTRQVSTSVPVAYDDVLTNVVPAVGAGIDLWVRLGQHLALVPSARAHYLVDDDTPDGQPPRRGVGSVVAAGAIGLAVRF
jgi:hypothetical protein